MILDGWIGLATAAVLMHLSMTAALVVITARQLWLQHRAELQDQQAAAWIASVLSDGGGPPANPCETIDPPASFRAQGDLVAGLSSLLERGHGGLAQGSAPVERLARRLRLAFAPLLSRRLEAIDRRLGSQSRRRFLRRCSRILSYAPSAELLPTLLSVATVKDAGLAIEALRAIGCGCHSYEAATVPLAGRLREAGGAVRLVSHWALAELLAAHRRNISLLAADPDAAVRRSALAAAASWPSASVRTAEAIAVLEHGCRDSDVAVRSRAYRALAGAQPRPSQLLRAALADPASEVQAAAVDGLGPSDDPDVAWLLIESFPAAAPPLAGVLARALSQFCGAPPAALLRRVEGRAGTAGAVLEAAAHLGHRDVAPALSSFLQDARPGLRRHAARGLAILARALFPEALDRQVVELLLHRLATEREHQILAGVIDAVTFAADERGVAAMMARIPAAPIALRERLVEAIATLERIRPETAERPVAVEV